MPIREILQYPNPRLALKSSAADPKSDSAKACAQDIIDTMQSMDNAAGLAAPQINQHLRIVGMYLNGQADLRIFINPELSNFSDEFSKEVEACLSVDGAVFSALVKRPVAVTVTAYDVNGEQFSLDLDGFAARCIQHEVDHLDGVLFVDHLSRLKRMQLKKSLLKQVG